MPNKFFNPMDRGGRALEPPSPASNQRPGQSSSPGYPEKTANYPGVPGKTQPGGRLAGTKRAKTHPQSEGL